MIHYSKNKFFHNENHYDMIVSIKAVTFLRLLYAYYYMLYLYVSLQLYRTVNSRSHM